VSGRNISTRGRRLILGLGLVASLLATGWASTETRLFNFGGTLGKSPNGGLIWDAAGNLYGTTQSGGLNNAGVVFQLHRTISGVWIENILYNFVGTTDGGNPQAGLIWDAAGNLYGTTTAGGASGMGTVFELSPNGHGGWTESVIYSFAGGSDGASPMGKVVFDGSGNLYGTTEFGGPANVGTVFQLSPTGSGYNETVLHAFSGPDGSHPMAELILDASENLYGTTYQGGVKGVGTVFELVRGSGWTESVLHHFKNYPDGAYPNGGLVFNGSNLLGTTTGGYGDGLGTVFELVNHVTSYTDVVYGFYRGQGGDYPVGTLTFNSANATYYGSTALGTFQAGESAGTVFSLALGASIVDVYSFTGGIVENVTHDGEIPQGGLALDGAGNLFGSTLKGGTGAGGTVFEVTP